MDVHFDILPEEQLIVETLSGEVTIEDIFEKTKVLVNHPDFRSDYPGVLDMRKAKLSVTRPEMYAFAEFINQMDSLRDAKWAVVVTDPLMTALSELVRQRVMNTTDIGVFSSVQGAANFIGKKDLATHLSPD